jgi:hypothetical protein
MAVLGGLLFVRGMQGPSLDDALRHHGSTFVHQLVDKLGPAEIASMADDALLEKVVAEVAIEPLALDLAAAKPSATEVQLEHVNAWRERVRVSGLRIAKAIPFSGDPQLWQLAPSTFDLNPPRGTIRGNAVVIGMEVPTEQNQQAVDYINETVSKIQTYIERQRPQIDTFNASLVAKVQSVLQARRQRLGAAADVLKKLS